jgi:hypothetical protein
MEDLLQTLMQGGQPQSSAEGTGSDADPLAQLLQSLLGGGAPQGFGAQAGPAPVQGGLDLASLLQGALGGTGGLAGGAAQTPTGGAGGFGDVLATIMGGGSPTLESDAILAPIVTGLAEKLGLPPQVAQTVVVFILGKLTGHRLQPGMDTTPPPIKSQAARPQATSLEDVVQRMNSGQRVTKTSIRNAGLAKELAAHTGLNRATAEASLQEVLNALGGQLTAGK